MSRDKAKKLVSSGVDRVRGFSGGADADLRARVEQLEDEIQECRQLNVRIAELTDIVSQLLLPVAARDEAKLEELLTKYRQGFF